MVLNYSLCAIIHRTDSSNLLSELAKLLDSGSSIRLKHLTWKPATEISRQTFIGTTEIDASGIANLLVEEWEQENYYCFSLQIKLEPEFRDVDESISFGCMWTSIFAGAKYLLIQMTAASTNMSLTVQKSNAIHNVWQNFAKKIDAIVAYIDIEEDCCGIQLFPNVGEIQLPDWETLAYQENCHCHYSIDLMTKFIIAVNDLLSKNLVIFFH